MYTLLLTQFSYMVLRDLQLQIKHIYIYVYVYIMFQILPPLARKKKKRKKEGIYNHIKINFYTKMRYRRYWTNRSSPYINLPS